MQETSLCVNQSFQTILHTTAVTTTTTAATTATAMSKWETKSNQFPNFFWQQYFCVKNTSR